MPFRSTAGLMGMLANRLTRNLKHLRKWARRTGVSCYRVYQDDIPEYPLAVDHYQELEGGVWALGFVTPRRRDPSPQAQEAYMLELTEELATGLGITGERVVLKQRGRRPGGTAAQPDLPHHLVWVQEGGLRFQVDLTGYHDTGLFLDHRQTRAMVAALCPRQEVLNLFCYTGSFSVYAGAAGARRVTSVDLSHTYLDWAERNLRANGLDMDRQRLIRADVLAWLPEAARRGERFGVIVCDPPTFSNSKSMERTLDIGLAHPELINGCLRLLPPQGTLFFSTNDRGFQLAGDRLHPCRWEEISAQTVPEDFRDRKAHRCFKFCRA